MGGYVRSRHRRDERHFEVIAGKVINTEGNPSRFAFARNSPAIASDAFKKALAAAGADGGDAGDSVTCDGDAGPVAAATRGAAERHDRARLVACRDVRFEHALQAARAAWKARPTRTWPTRRFARTGTCRSAQPAVAWALARMPTQTRWRCAAGRGA